MRAHRGHPLLQSRLRNLMEGWTLAPRWRRRGVVLRVAVLLALMLCYYLFHSLRLNDSLGSAPKKRPPLPSRDGSASTLRKLGIDPQSLREDASQLEDLPKNELENDITVIEQSAQPVQVALLDEDTTRPRPSTSGEPLSSSLLPSSATDLEQVGIALRNLLWILPDESQVEDLLATFRGTGAVKLRDVGAKTRAYKKYFELWEALHLVYDDDHVHIRQNMIQFIRDNHNKLDLADTTLAQTLRSYENFRHLVTSLAELLFPWTAPYFSDHMSLHASLYKAGRGIVLTAGPDQVAYLLATIPTMRHLGCTLPIEVMYLGDEDISEDYRERLELLPGVITRDIKQMARDTGWELSSWAAKPFAMLLSSFQEVMFIDADAVFFRNPALLFEDPQYKQHGALFFMDRSIFPSSKRRWLRTILPKPISNSVKQIRLWTGESGHQQESGVVLIDKWRHFMELLLVTRMNGPDRDGDKDRGLEGVYDMVFGDKETLWLAWEILQNNHYAFHKGFRGSMGVAQTGFTFPGKPEQVTEQPTGSGDFAGGLARKAGMNSTIPRSGYQPSPDANDDTVSDVNSTADTDTTAFDIADGAAGEQSTSTAVPPLSRKTNLSTPLGKRSTPSDPDPESPTDYTICASQLLHLDADRKPLWFNGWLARTKYKDSSQSAPARFEAWNIEPYMASETDAWQLGEGNEACLATESVTAFTEEEREVLDMVIGLAQEVGALGKRKGKKG